MDFWTISFIPLVSVPKDGRFGGFVPSLQVRLAAGMSSYDLDSHMLDDR